MARRLRRFAETYAGMELTPEELAQHRRAAMRDTLDAIPISVGEGATMLL